MTPDGESPDPAAVVSVFGLPGPVTAWSAVGRAWSNRVYRLGAGDRGFAVKEMRNPWADPHWQEWLAESWPFERRAIAAGIAASAVKLFAPTARQAATTPASSQPTSARRS